MQMEQTEGDQMKKHTPSTASQLAVISGATVLLIALLWLALLPSAYAGQATDPIPLSAIQPLGKSLGAPAVSPTPAYTVYLPLVIRSAVGAPTPAPTQTTTPGTPPVQEGLFLTRTNKTDSASIAVDAAGGFHFAYAAYVHDASGHRPAYYAYCAPAADCGIESNWATVSLSDDVEDVQLALTKAGYPRLLLRGDEPTAPFDTLFQYAACDANCTDLANWTGVDLTTAQYSLVYLKDYPRHYFALDNQDRPRFLYRKNINDGYYAYCDADCSTTGTWTQYLVDPLIFSDPTNFPNLTFTSADQPRISATTFIGNPPDSKRYLTYIACDSACENPASWTGVPLMEAGSGHTSSVLRYNSSGQPRMIFSQGTISGTAGYLYYLWCNSGCNDIANWDASVTGMGAGLAQDPDLALDVLGRPRIAFRILSPGGLFFGFCNVNCESHTGYWQGDISERDTLLDAEWVILPWVNPCSPTASYWYGGKRPSLALDTAGNVRIGYVAEHLVQAYEFGGCAAYEDMRAVRFVFFPKP
jgi:hypothetical protein